VNAIFGASWRTSLIGYVSAALIAVMPMIQNGDGPNWKELLIAAVVAVAGRIVKDANVSGTTDKKAAE